MRKRLVFVVAGVVAAAAAVAVFAGGGDIFGDPPRPPDDASLPPAPTLPPGGDCPYGPIGFQGRIACIPPGASAGGSPLNEYPPDLPSGTLLPPEYSLIRRGGSFITYTTGQVLEWNVAPGDEADFVPLRDVFGIPEGVPFIPPPGPLVGDACPYGAIAFRGVVSCLPQRTEHFLATVQDSTAVSADARAAVYSIQRGGSVVRYSYANGVLEWNVAPEDEADFAAVRDVLYRP